MNPPAFLQLCDTTDALLRYVRSLPDSPTRTRLWAFVEAYDAIIDALVGLDCTTIQGEALCLPD